MNYDKLEFYINDDKIKDYDVSSEQFEQEIGNLKKGDNKVYIIAINSETKDERKSQVYGVSYVSEKPKLDISQPQDNAKVNKMTSKLRDLPIKMYLSK